MLNKTIRVGFLADVNSTNQFTFNQPYYNFCRQISTDITLISPIDGCKPEDIDILILPGGSDVYSGRYGAVAYPGTVYPPNNNFEFFDTNHLGDFIEKNVAIFGICRGHQTLNVHFNGTLKHHVNGEPTSEKYRGELVHYCKILENGKYLKINSLHHQAIDELGNNIIPTLQGFSVEGKTKEQKQMEIEGMKHEYLPIAGVQWHPEEILEYLHVYNNKQSKDNKIPTERMMALSSLNFVRNEIIRILELSWQLRGVENKLEGAVQEARQLVIS